ncbi:MAG: hypothetical protein KDD55_11210 [Bdellovibrionales bacterium]|nr:hypothetical protein [Bdellovibrionales bacterium]
MSTKRDVGMKHAKLVIKLNDGGDSLVNYLAVLHKPSDARREEGGSKMELTDKM